MGQGEVLNKVKVVFIIKGIEIDLRGLKMRFER